MHQHGHHDHDTSTSSLKCFRFLFLPRITITQVLVVLLSNLSPPIWLSPRIGHRLNTVPAHRFRLGPLVGPGPYFRWLTSHKSIAPVLYRSMQCFRSCVQGKIEASLCALMLLSAECGELSASPPPADYSFLGSSSRVTPKRCIPHISSMSQTSHRNLEGSGDQGMSHIAFLPFPH
jgi:hypothetical protein